MKHLTPILFCFALFLAACQPIVLLSPPVEAAQDAPASEEQIAEVRAASAAWDEAFNAGDLAQLLLLYADDAVDMPPGLPALEGIDAIAGDLEYVLTTFDAHHETSIVDIKIDGDIAIERAGYIMELIPKDGGDTINEVGKHVVVRQKVGDDWMVLWEIWNSDGE